MDKYRRVEKSKAHDAAPVEANEIRITQQGNVRSYISYANGLFAVRLICIAGSMCALQSCVLGADSTKTL